MKKGRLHSLFDGSNYQLRFHQRQKDGNGKLNKQLETGVLAVIQHDEGIKFNPTISHLGVNSALLTDFALVATKFWALGKLLSSKNLPLSVVFLCHIVFLSNRDPRKRKKLIFLLSKDLTIPILLFLSLVVNKLMNYMMYNEKPSDY